MALQTPNLHQVNDVPQSGFFVPTHVIVGNMADHATSPIEVMIDYGTPLWFDKANDMWSVYVPIAGTTQIDGFLMELDWMQAEAGAGERQVCIMVAGTFWAHAVYNQPDILLLPAIGMNELNEQLKELVNRGSSLVPLGLSSATFA